MLRKQLRQQYHFRNSTEGVLAWDVYRLIELSATLPVELVPLSLIEALDEAFWYELGGATPTCRNIVEHAKLIQGADLTYSIILCHQGRVIDGMHRVGKALLNGDIHIKAVRFEQPLEPDYINVDPAELPY